MACDNLNSPIVGETNKSFTATENGHYAVIITKDACPDTSACYAITSIVGIDKNDFKNTISVFPNPTDKIINIVLDEPLTSVILNVISLNGQVLINKRIDNAGSNFIVDISELKNGLYFLELISEKKTARIAISKN